MTYKTETDYIFRENSDSEEEGLTNLEKEALVVKFLSNNLVAFTTSLGAYRDGNNIWSSRDKGNLGSEAEEPVKQLASYVSNTSLYWKARQDVLNELLSLVYRSVSLLLFLILLLF